MNKMFKPTLSLFFSLLLSSPLIAAPVKIIFDSDFTTDVDDVGAMALMHALADNGEAEILAVGSSSSLERTPGAMDVINTYYGRPNIPIGITKKGPAINSSFVNKLYDSYPHNTPLGRDVEDVVKVYRRVLAKQPDNSVVFITVGYSTNLAELMKSPPDSISSLSGMDLVNKKIKEWACMGGNFFTTSQDNVNFHRDRSSVHYAVTNFKKKITFMPREVSSVPSPLRAGNELKQTEPNNPVLFAYKAYYGGGSNLDRHVADPATVLYAVRGIRDYWNIHTTGYMDLGTDGKFVWRENVDKDHNYLVMKGGYQVYSNKAYVEGVIRGLMKQTPKSLGGGGSTPEPEPNPTPDPDIDPEDTVHGLEASYYNGANFNNFVTSGVVSKIDMNWGSGSPVSGMNNDSFSARFEGYIKPLHTSGQKSYNFTLSVNDGARLYIGSKLLIDAWQSGPLKEVSASINLDANKFYPIKVEFFENTHSAQLQLFWTPSGSAKSMVPAEQLFKTADNDSIPDEPAPSPAPAPSPIPPNLQIYNSALYIPNALVVSGNSIFIKNSLKSNANVTADVRMEIRQVLSSGSVSSSSIAVKEFKGEKFIAGSPNLYQVSYPIPANTPAGKYALAVFVNSNGNSLFSHTGVSTLNSFTVKAGSTTQPSPSPSPTPAPAPAPTPTPAPDYKNGLKVSYYNGSSFNTLKSSGVVSSIDVSWGSKAPVSGMNDDNFSVRYEGLIKPLHGSGSKTYEFMATVNDGVRVYIGDKLVVDGWKAGPLKEVKGSISLDANKYYPIRVEFFENTHTAELHLFWSSQGMSRRIVPAAQLFHK